jgi:hypothetical protein
MINWLAQALLDSAGFVASCFITRDAAQFGLMQGAVALVLLVSIVAVLAFWPAQWTISLNQIHKRCQMDWRPPRGSDSQNTQVTKKVVSFWVQITPVIVVCAVMFAIAVKYL